MQNVVWTPERIAAWQARDASIDLRTSQAQLGHASFALTAETYISILPRTAFTAAQDTAALRADAHHVRHRAHQRRLAEGTDGCESATDTAAPGRPSGSARRSAP